MQWYSYKTVIVIMHTVMALGLITQPPAWAATTFFNTTPITIAGTDEIGIGAPYPSFITVSGLLGSMSSVTATVYGLSHTSIADIGILLVGPGQQSVVLMDFVGSGEIVSAEYNFDDTAAEYLPFTGMPSSGTYRPTAYDAAGLIVPQIDTFTSPAPSSGYSSIGLSIFNGLEPNGVYALYVEDFIIGDAGILAGGWSLTLTTQVVAEPSSLALFGIGALPLALLVWRRRRVVQAGRARHRHL